jgi:hypothetical protein
VGWVVKIIIYQQFIQSRIIFEIYFSIDDFDDDDEGGGGDKLYKFTQ